MIILMKKKIDVSLNQFVYRERETPINWNKVKNYT